VNRHALNIDPALSAYLLVAIRVPFETVPGFAAQRPSMAIAEMCSCNFGIPAIHGHRRNVLLQFRHTGHPWP
jgi:hypothetical protein